MPKVIKPILEADQSIVRPIAIALIQEVMIDRLGLSKDIPINFPGFTDTVSQPKGLISNPYEDNRMPSTDKMTIEVTENMVEEWMPANVQDKPEHIPLFLNRDLETELRPIYASMEMRISIHYRAKGKTDAQRFYNLMKSKLPRREDTWLHKLNYSFSLPKAFLVILQEIHRLQELNEGYGEDFDTFMTKWINPRYGNLTDQGGKNTLGVFSDTQARCMGFFDQQPMPTDGGGRKDETDVWEIEIPYVLRYEKPSDVYMQYPIIIHNSILSTKFRNESGFERVEDTQSCQTLSLGHLSAFAMGQNTGKVAQNQPGRYFPLYDEFIPRNVPQCTMRVFTALMQVSPPNSPDPLLLMNVRDLEAEGYGMVINERLREFMASEHQWITTPRESAVQISLYTGRLLMDGVNVEMDEDLNIRSTKPLSMRKYYHVRFSVITDLTYLSDAAKDRLKLWPDIFDLIVDYILPEGATRPKPTQVIPGRISDKSFDQIAEELRGRTVFNVMKTVQTTIINGVYQMKK